jgi:hypothetical protein
MTGSQLRQGGCPANREQRRRRGTEGQAVLRILRRPMDRKQVCDRPRLVAQGEQVTSRIGVRCHWAESEYSFPRLVPGTRGGVLQQEPGGAKRSRWDCGCLEPAPPRKT